MNETIPANLNAAIATQPMMIRVWIMVLVAVNLVAILFILTRQRGKLKIRPESMAVVVSFFAAGLFMSWLYGRVGYVRLLGLPHLIFWTPVYIWLFLKFRKGEFKTPFKQYVMVYLVIAGISLVIDAVDVVRYGLGQ
ncbi:MAG: hypothetical protein MJE63_33240 [Proteobacteria bacterium]|nr:hypothetical protein [Pseudomonadota bacterium]